MQRIYILSYGVMICYTNEIIFNGCEPYNYNGSGLE